VAPNVSLQVLLQKESFDSAWLHFQLCCNI
jgi:hypothetical protein